MEFDSTSYLAGDDPSPTNGRVKWLARGGFFWAALIVGRLVQLQVLQHDMYKSIAFSQQERVMDVPAPRGAILDRTGERLAMSVPCESVCVNPMRITDPEMAAKILAHILQLNEQELYAKIRLYSDNRNGFLWIKRKISDEESERLHKLKYSATGGVQLDWLEFRTESKRVYAYNGLAAHVLGGVDFEEKGNSGIELAMNDELTGQNGLVRVTTDVKRRGWSSKSDLDATPGKTVRLTILSRLQYLAEQELKKAVEGHHCKSGSLIAMDPATGEILALANYPSYDPNVRPQKGDDPKARLNLALSTPFEPGSVFKVITISAALETTNIQPSTVVSCGNGSLSLFGRVIHDHNSYSALAVEDVLARSSNIGAINIGLRVGDASMYEYVTRFGFGKRTGLPASDESAGIVRPLKRWQKSSIGSVAMGHEISVTSVQLAQACSVIANGGYLVRPKLVLGGKAPDPVQVLKPETAITMRHMMEGVVIKPYGTGFRYAHIPGYTSAGKTGTAQIYDAKAHVYTHLYNASFMGFAPVTNPRIVVVVTVNGASGEAGYGGPASAPAFREVAAAALRLLAVPKDLPNDVLPQIADGKADQNDVALVDLASSQPDEALAEAANSDQRLFLPAQHFVPAEVTGPTAPNFVGMTMREVVQRSAQQGIPVDFAGRGIVRSQTPPPGDPIPVGERIRVRLGR